MLDHLKKKIIRVSNLATDFFKKNLAQIVLLFFIFQLLMFARSLPYINIVENYVFYCIAILLLIAVLLFKVSVPNKILIQFTLALFIVAMFTTIFALSKISDLLGFIIYILIFFVVTRKVVRERNQLKHEEEI